MFACGWLWAHPVPMLHRLSAGAGVWGAEPPIHFIVFVVCGACDVLSCQLVLVALAAALSHFLCSQRKLLSAFVALVHAACLAREVVHAVCLCSRIHVHGMFMFHGISCFGPVFRSVSLLNLVFGAFFFHGSFMFWTICCSQKHFNTEMPLHNLTCHEPFHVLDIVAFVMLSCFGPVFIPTHPQHTLWCCNDRS